jgi:hypothetical protein
LFASAQQCIAIGVYGMAMALLKGIPLCVALACGYGSLIRGLWPPRHDNCLFAQLMSSNVKSKNQLFDAQSPHCAQLTGSIPKKRGIFSAMYHLKTSLDAEIYNALMEPRRKRRKQYVVQLRLHGSVFLNYGLIA